jgi:hypothetical protein
VQTKGTEHDDHTAEVRGTDTTSGEPKSNSPAHSRCANHRQTGAHGPTNAPL